MEKANKFLEMTIFIAIIDTGSFVAAAEKLDMSKQAISRYISALEQRLQVRLLHRTTRKLSLTDEGQNFYLQAKAVLASLDEAEASLNPQQGDPVGRIKINAPLSFGILHLAPLWQQFSTRYPKIELDITLADRLVDLVEEGYDLAIRIAQLPNSTLISRKLASTRVILSASPAYLKTHGLPKHPDDLRTHQIISYSLRESRDEWHFMHQQTEITVHVKPYIHVNNGDSCRIITLQDGGISLQPDFIIGEDLKNGDLIELLPEYTTPILGIYAVYPTRKLLPLRIRCLIDFLVEALKAPTWKA